MPAATAMREDYYAILEVPRNVDATALRRAFMAKAQQWHPDKAPEGERATYESKFRRLSEAYEALSDPHSRAAYDRELQYGSPRTRTTTTQAGPTIHVHDADQFWEEFSQRVYTQGESRRTRRETTYAWTDETMDPKQAERAVRNLRIWGGLGIVVVVMGALLLGFVALVFGMLRMLVGAVFGIGRRSAPREA